VRRTDEIENFSKTRQGLLRAVAEIYGGEQSNATIRMANHWVASRQHLSTGEVCRELVDHIHPLIAVEKSPSYTISLKRMQAIYRTFPDARFLHLVRHPVATCKSIMALNEGAFALYVNSIDFLPDRAIIDPQFAWHDLHINILNFLDQVPKSQQMRVRGEDIMEDPSHFLGDVCRWLGIRDDAAAIEEMMHPERSPFACFGPITALFGNDPNFLRGPAFRSHKVKIPPMNKPLEWRPDGQHLHPQVLSLAHELGYQ
jgi:hypothetical protein